MKNERRFNQADMEEAYEKVSWATLFGDRFYGTVEDLSDLFDKNGMTQSEAALEFAMEKHDGQFRRPEREGRPYFSHPVEMAGMAICLIGDESGKELDHVIAAILLHDVCEDCHVAVDELPVGAKAKELVKYLTKTDDCQGVVYNHRLLVEAPVEACLIKILDRVSNLSEAAAGFSADKLEDYLNETWNTYFRFLSRIRSTYPQAEWVLRGILMSQIRTLRVLVKAWHKAEQRG